MFKWLLEFSLANRLLVVLTGVALMLWGGVTLRETPVDVFPDLDKPTVTILTEAGGMAAEEVEQTISFPLESALAGLPQIESVRSVSSAGLSFIYVSFDWSADLYRARQMVTERLAAMETALPAQVTPRLGPISSLMGEILQIAIPVDTAKTSTMAVREYADWVLRPRLLAIPGVAQVIPIGGEIRQYQVQPDPVRMAALGVTQGQLRDALADFARNTSGGFLEMNGREVLIRHLGQTTRLADLQSLALGVPDTASSVQANSQPVLLQQIADVRFAPAVKRGDAGFEGRPAIILGVQKQPGADTVDLTARVETALADLGKTLPAGMDTPRVTFRQASFIEASIATLEGKLVAAAVCVAVVLALFLGTLRPVFIALTAIPVSILVAALVFDYFGLSINTMTLGGLAIAIGGLVDDALVDVENILRRMKRARADGVTTPLATLIRDASLEVRSGIVYATVIVVLVFLPLFALPGIEGRLFAPLGIAFVVATLASLLVSVTLTPVLAAYLLPGMKSLDHGDTRLLAWLKARYQPLLEAVLARPNRALAAGGLAALAALAAVPFFATSFLPAFNEGTLVIGLRLNPGVTLTESSALASAAEKRLREVPEVVYVGRRSGRAELDEHAEGVHASELDVGLKPASELTRSMDEINADIRARLANFPAAIAIGQPISHRIDHMLSGVRSQIAIKLFGDDLDTLRGQAETLRARLASVPGLADLEVEKQVLAPQVKVRIDYAAAAQYGVPAPRILEALGQLVEGETVSQINEGGRRFDLVVRLSDAARTPGGLADLLIDTPRGAVPLSKLARIEEGDGPNQISRDDGKRRIVLSANVQGRALSDVIADLRAAVADTPLPDGYFVTLGGQFEAQETAARRIGLLSAVALALMFGVLVSRYQSARLALIVMANIPLALIGGVAGLALAGQTLSIAALVGFVTLAGISVRNGILKVSHYLNLMKNEGEAFDTAMLVRGSLERLAPVLMTALVTAFALAPLLFEAERPGTEILHPLAVVVFAGLISATLLDSFLTPAMFWRFGRSDAERLTRAPASGAF